MDACTSIRGRSCFAASASLSRTAGWRPPRRRRRPLRSSAATSSSRRRCSPAGAARRGWHQARGRPDEAESHARAILGMDINGHVVRKLWVESASDIATEYYLSLDLRPGREEGALHVHEGGSTSRRSPPSGRALARLRRSPRGLPAVPGATTDLRRLGSRTRASKKQIAKIASSSSMPPSSAPTRCSARSTR